MLGANVRFRRRRLLPKVNDDKEHPNDCDVTHLRNGTLEPCRQRGNRAMLSSERRTSVVVDIFDVVVADDNAVSIIRV